MGRVDGDVLFGRRLFREIMQRPEHPEIGIAAVCAHEFGHIVQYKYGIRDRLVGSDKRVKRLELHADFLAGYFAGLRKLERSNFPAAEFAATQFSFGDKAFGSIDHHGTPNERGAAVVAGYQAAFRDKQSFGTALETGVRYALQISLTG
jgi:predicted metalloprotease